MHVARAPPRAEKKNWGPNLQGKAVSAPLVRAIVHFFRKLGYLDGGRGHLGSFSVCFDFEGDNKKRSTF